MEDTGPSDKGLAPHLRPTPSLFSLLASKADIPRLRGLPAKASDDTTLVAPRRSLQLSSLRREAVVHEKCSSDRPAQTKNPYRAEPKKPPPSRGSLACIDKKVSERQRVTKEREHIEQLRAAYEAYRSDLPSLSKPTIIRSEELTQLLHVIDEVKKYLKSPTSTCNFIYWNRWTGSGILVGDYPRPNSSTLQHLQSNRITIVINLCTDEEIEQYGDYSLRWSSGSEFLLLRFPFASGTAPSSSHLIRFLTQEVIPHWSDDSIVYIHSGSGHGRANLVAAYLYSLYFREYHVYKLYERLRASYRQHRRFKIRIGDYSLFPSSSYQPLDTWEQYQCLEQLRGLQQTSDLEQIGRSVSDDVATRLQRNTSAPHVLAAARSDLRRNSING